MRKLNFAVVGAGSMANIYANIISTNPLTNLTAIVGNSRPRTEALGKQYRTKAIFEGNVAALLNEHPEIDALVVATPEWVRESPIAECVSAGKHFLYEKPLAASLKEAKKIYRLLKDYEPVTMACHSLRFAPHFAQAVEAVHRGAIGELRHFATRRNGNHQIAKRIIEKIHPCYWLSPHDIDMMHWMSGSKVEWVQAWQRDAKNPLDDYLMVQMHFENKVDAQHLVSWCSPPIAGTATQALFEVFGTAGMLSINDNSVQSVSFEAGNGVNGLDSHYAPQVQGNVVGGFRNMFDHFIQNVLESSTPLVTLDDAYESIRVCSAIEKSLQEKRAVHLEEIK
jgi:UDP-N-acetylglucosamine 3-dehydrogenase